MKIQSSPNPNTFGSVVTEKNKQENEGLDGKKKTSGKPKFVVRNEGGYIRKFVIKANGDEILVMETKQQEKLDGTVEGESGDIVDMAHDMLMKQLEVHTNFLKEKKETVSVWEQKSSISKYKTGI